MEELNPNNDLGESYVLICTNVEVHDEHLINHFNEKLTVKIFDTFTDLFSNINIDSIQETYLKTSIYNRVFGQYMNETNTKYG